MQYSIVSEDDQLNEAMDALSRSELIGFDTEFVAEDCYQPDLCLLQFSSREHVYIVDPKSLSDLSACWQLLVDPQKVVLVHAGREEILFVHRATGKTIPGLFDVQVAVGLLGGEYPASYGKLLQRILNITVPKGETRTDWRKRPLSSAQLEYAALDVYHLPELYDSLYQQLQDQGREDWLTDEIATRQAHLVRMQEQESWVRISGVQSLHRRQLGIVRELWKWREQRAQQKNMPARRVLRDDLIIELARRGWSDPRKISHIRGLHHAGFQRFLPDIAKCIQTGKQTEISEVPWNRDSKRGRPPALLQQFLTAAMSYLCRTHHIAPSIVGTSDDVGRLAAYWIDGRELDEDHPGFPNLLKGWRRKFVGDPLHEIFAGKRALRVQDPRDDMPLALCSVDSK